MFLPIVTAYLTIYWSRRLRWSWSTDPSCFLGRCKNTLNVSAAPEVFVASDEHF